MSKAGRAVLGLFAVGVFAGLIYIAIESPHPATIVVNHSQDDQVRAGAEWPAARPPQAPPERPHYYSMFENGLYGYEQALSEDDKKAGLLTKPMFMVRYLGKRYGHYQVSQSNGDFISVLDCSEPCSYVNARVVFNGTLISEQTIPATNGTINWVIFQDILLGNLSQYTEVVDNQRMRTWYGDDNQVHFYPIDTQ